MPARALPGPPCSQIRAEGVFFRKLLTWLGSQFHLESSRAMRTLVNFWSASSCSFSRTVASCLGLTMVHPAVLVRATQSRRKQNFTHKLSHESAHENAHEIVYVQMT